MVAFAANAADAVDGFINAVACGKSELSFRTGLVSKEYSPLHSQRTVNAGKAERRRRQINQADDAVKVSREQLSAFLQAGPEDDELELSRKNITGGFPLRIASNSNIVEYLAVIGFYGLPLDYLDTFNSKIDAVKKADIIAAYKKNVTPDKMVTVIVGGPENTAQK